MSNDVFPRESRAARLKTMSPSAGATIEIVNDTTLIVRGCEESREHVLRRAKVAATVMGFEIGWTTGRETVITIEAR